MQTRASDTPPADVDALLRNAGAGPPAAPDPDSDPDPDPLEPLPAAAAVLESGTTDPRPPIPAGLYADVTILHGHVLP